jgi:hypothetical protein
MVAFVTAYRARMDALGAYRVMGLIRSVVPLGTAVLLCYEALDGIEPDQQKYTCHRRALADWITGNTGWDVPELGTTSTPKQDLERLTEPFLPF